MPFLAPHSTRQLQPPRRAALKTLMACAIYCTGVANLLFPASWAQASGTTGSSGAITPLGMDAQALRAMSRVGYGPTAALVRTVQAAPSPKEWALQQVDLAFAASKKAPRIAANAADFNAPLPQLFSAVKQERLLRKQNMAQADKDNKPGPAPANFTGKVAPEYFSRHMMLQAAAWRLQSCSRPDEENPLLARMTEFWFNHLNVFVDKGQVRPFTGHYVVNVARAHALGKFEDLLLASARHPAMLYYLDQWQSVAEGSRGGKGKMRGLNENYARELMELHTLGVNGGYTQNDVRELARVLTGWTIAPNDESGFRFAAGLHDTGSKQVMGQVFQGRPGPQGEGEGQAAIRMLARHPATAQRISLRLAQFFVADNPPAELVQRLAKTFLDSQGDMRVVMRSLLSSPEFWNAENRLFKTPMDFVCSALAATQSDTPEGQPPEQRTLAQTAGFLRNAGQPLHGWQTPDGYSTDAATWLVPEALTRRVDFALALGRNAGNLDYLTPFLSPATREAIAKERPALRAGLVLASPDFMYK